MSESAQPILRSFRYAFRSLRRRPAFTLSVVLTLGLGIGITVTIFSIAYEVSMAPLPFADPDELVWAYGTSPTAEREGVSPNDFRDYREAADSFEHLAAATNFSPLYNLTSREEPIQLSGRGITAGFFETLGVPLELGREFTVADETNTNEKVAILSYDLWQRVYEGDRDVVGSTIGLNDVPYTIVGVVPEWMNFLGDSDVFEPQQSNAPTLRAIRFLVMFGRLADGVTLSQAQQEMDSLAGALEEQFPDTNTDWRVRLAPLEDHILGPSRPTLLLLPASVLLVLLIAVANVSILMLVRASRTAGDTAIRAALGASRPRIAGQYLSEALILSLSGGVVGFLFSIWGIATFKRMAPQDLPRLDQVAPDGGILLVALVISLLTGLAFGILPALRMWRPDLVRFLQQGGRTAKASGRAGALLIVGEVALSLVLLVGAGLLLHSLTKLQQVDPGFETDGMLITRVVLPMAKYPTPEARVTFWDALVERLEALPGAASAAVTTELPLAGQDNPTDFKATTAEGETYVVNLRSVSPGLLETLKIPLRSGRTIQPEDRADSPKVVVISERMEREVFRGESAVGERLNFDFGAGPYEAEIVGVVGDIRHDSLAEEPFRETYFPVSQTPLLTYNAVVRSSVENPLSLAPAARAAVWDLDPAQSLGPFSTMDDLVAEELREPRFRTTLVTVFSLLALLLAGVGLYAVISYAVSQRTREIGVRMAMGASRNDIVGMIMGRGLVLTVWGLGLGLLGAFLLVRLVQTLLYGVGTMDPVSFAVACLVLVGVALLASYLPSRRAARMDPTLALRVE